MLLFRSKRGRRRAAPTRVGRRLTRTRRRAPARVPTVELPSVPRSWSSRR